MSHTHDEPRSHPLHPLHPLHPTPPRRRTLALLAGSALWPLLAPAQTSAAHALPKVIRLIVGYPPGGPVDDAARVLAVPLSRELGVQVIVENRPGAGGSLGGDVVAKAAPDGATLYLGASPTITINPNVQPRMAFDPMKDLTPIAPLVAYTNVLVVNNKLPVHSVSELLSYAKAHPQAVTYGSAGVGASNHLSGALLEKITGAPMLHVAYKGSAQALLDVMTGTVSMMFVIIATSRPLIESGKVRALAVTSRERNRMLPGLPTMIEAGVAGFDIGGWFGLYGPARMDPALVTRLNAAARKAVASEALTARFLDQGYEVWTGDPQVLAAKGIADRALWARASQGIEAE